MIITGTSRRLATAFCLWGSPFPILACKSGLQETNQFEASHRQERIDHGSLLRWTKGWGAPNVEGHDVVEMLNVAIKKYVSNFFD
jgi:hypothetical protein